MCSKIEWTQETWNPVTGCSEVSEGCRNCYARPFAMRLKAMGTMKYRNGFDVTCHDSLINEPLRWKKPRDVFVNSMSDLFHCRVPTQFISLVMMTMAKAKQHTFQVITKRSGRLAEFSNPRWWTDNIWLGVTVENNDALYRVTDLKKIPARVRFLSCEPLLGPLDVDLRGIDWVIVGGESGRGQLRKMKPQWAMDIRDKCEEAGIPFFFKQWGGRSGKQSGCRLDGKEYKQRPERAA